MADGPNNSALQESEQDDFGIPGQDDTGSQNSDMGAQTGPPPPPDLSGSVQQRPNAPQGPSPVQVDTTQKVHPHMAILAGLVNKVLTGIQNAPGNPAKALDRGFMQASPNNQAMQQAAVSKATSEADLAKQQVAIAGMKAIQLKYMIQRLPQEEQSKYLDSLGEFKNKIIKLGGQVEAEADDQQGAEGKATLLSNTDPRATNHAGRFYAMPEPFAPGKPPKWDVVYIPTKEVLQDAIDFETPDGEKVHLDAGMPIGAGFAKAIQAFSTSAQSGTKALHQQMGKALGVVPEGEVTQTANWLESQKNQNSAIYQQNKDAIDKQIPTLRATEKQVQQEKLSQAAAGREEAHADDAVYAYDPENKSYELTTKKNAGGRETFKQTPEFDKALGKAQRLQDVTNKIFDYRDTFTHGMTTSDKHAIENFESEHPSMLAGPGIGKFKIQIGAEGAGLEEAARDLDQRQMSQNARDRLSAYITTKTVALEMQRIETESARMSTAGMQLDLGALARPSDDPETALKKIDRLMRSVKTFGKIRLKGIPTPEDIEKERPFDYEQFKEWEKSKLPEIEKKSAGERSLRKHPKLAGAGLNDNNE